MAKSKTKRKLMPNSILKLPDLEQSKSAVLNSLTSPSSQRTYDHAIREFIEWYCSEPRLAFNKTVVTRYRISLEQRHYASTTINLRLAAVRRLAYEAADCGLLSADLAAGIRRVKGAKRLRVPVGNWLSAEQGKRLLLTADGASLRGKRDYATPAIMLGCGLRRAELQRNRRVRCPNKCITDSDQVECRDGGSRRRSAQVSGSRSAAPDSPPRFSATTTLSCHPTPC
jgi:site-specific recombinase XerC